MAKQKLGRTAMQLAAACVMACWAGCALAQVSPGAGGAPAIPGARLVSNDPMEASKYLGTTYKDEAVGFRLAPPAGSRMITRSGVDLVSYVSDKQWGGSLQDVRFDEQQLLKDRQTEEMKLTDYVAATKTEMNKSFKGVQVTDERTIKNFQGREAVRLSTVVVAEGGGEVSRVGAMVKDQGPQRATLYRQEFIIHMKRNQFWVLRLYTPAADRELATRTFEAMINEFEIFNPVDLKKKRAEAIALGKQWLAQRTAEEFKGKMNNQPQLFRMKVDDDDVGYIQFTEMTQEIKKNGNGRPVDVERDGRKGILVQVQVRSFPPKDGSVNYGQNEAFWAYSRDAKGELLGHYSTWDNIAIVKEKVVINPGPAAPGASGPQVRELKPWNEETGVIVQELTRAFSAKEIAELEAQRQAMIENSKGKIVPPPISTLGPTPQFRVIVTFTGDPTQRLPQGYDEKIPSQEANPLPKVLEYTWTRFVDLTKPSEMSFVVYDSKAKKPALRNLIVTGKKETVKVGGKEMSLYKCIDELDPGFTSLWVDNAGRVQFMVASDHSVMAPTTAEEMKLKWAGRLGDQ